MRKFLDDESCRTSTINPAYFVWIQEDWILLLWIQSMLSSEILSRVLGCFHAHQLLGRLFSYFQKQTCARYFSVEFREITLDSLSVHGHLLEIRIIVDVQSRLKFFRGHVQEVGVSFN